MCYEQEFSSAEDRYNHRWQNGKGGYQLMQSFAYVGEGAGSYNLDAGTDQTSGDESRYCSPLVQKISVGAIILSALCAFTVYELAAHGVRSPLSLRVGAGQESQAARSEDDRGLPAAATAPERQMVQRPPDDIDRAALDAVDSDSFDRQTSATTTAMTTGAETASGEPYDCMVDFADWERLWPPKKQAYCCWKYDFGCRAAAPSVWAAPADSAQPAPTPLVAAWPVPTAEHAADDEATARQPAQSPPAPQPSPVPRAAVGVAGKEPPLVAPSPAPTADPRSCHSECNFPWGIATCKSRVRYLANRFGRLGGCKVALATVRNDCDLCRACSLEDTHCRDPSPKSSTRAPADDAADKRNAKKVARDRGYADVDEFAGEPLNCTDGEEDATLRWSAYKIAWCCLHERRGCPGEEAHGTTPAVAEADAQGPRADAAGVSVDTTFARPEVGSATKRAPQLGDVQSGMPQQPGKRTVLPKPALQQPLRPFDCKVGLSTLHLSWSAEKRAWCCHREHLGCSGAIV